MRKALALVFAALLFTPVLGQAQQVDVVNGLKSVYDKKKGESVDEQVLEVINQNFENNSQVKKALEVWDGTNVSLEVTENNTRIFAITAGVNNTSISTLYFGIPEGVGKDNNVYVKLEVSKFKNVLSEWVNLLSNGEPGLGDFIMLYAKTSTVTLSAIASGDIVVKPMWALFTKSYGMISALGAYQEFMNVLNTV